MRVREHRGSLADSLDTAVIIDPSRPALMEHVIKVCAPLLVVRPSDISVDYYGFETRLDEHQYIIKIAHYGVFGFIDEIGGGKIDWLRGTFYPELLERYREILREAQDWPAADKAGREHLLWMLDELERREEQSLTKKHRWLGFVQGVMIAAGLTTVDDERDETRALFNGA